MSLCFLSAAVSSRNPATSPTKIATTATINLNLGESWNVLGFNIVMESFMWQFFYAAASSYMILYDSTLWRSISECFLMFSFWCPQVLKLFPCPSPSICPFLWPKQHDVTSMSRYHLRSVPRVNCRPQLASTSLPPRNEHRRLPKPKVRLRQLSPSVPPQLCSNIAPRAFKMNPNALRSKNFFFGDSYHHRSLSFIVGDPYVAP